MLDYKLKIGLFPEIRDVANLFTRKGLFEAAKGKENKDKVLKFLHENFEDNKTEFVDLEWLNDLGLAYKTTDCEKIVEYYKKENVDAIFIINCNFGNEEACGQIAKLMELPVLLWGPQDMEFEPDGTRYTDGQCGLFAISKQLRRYQVPFSYIENCQIEDEAFRKGFKKFLSVATMVKNFKKLSIVQVGTRLNPFKSVMSNELELTEKFKFNLQTVNMAVVENKCNRLIETKATELIGDTTELKKKYKINGVSDDTLRKILNFVYLFIEIYDETGADVITTECWTAMPLLFGENPCLAMGILADMGYLVVCESDIHGAVTSALLSCASRGENPPIFGEFTTRHPENRNAELIWHCGPFPYSVKANDYEAVLYNNKPKFRAKDGEYTISRFQGDRGKYTLLGGKYHTTQGPDTFGTYMWGEFKDLTKLEKKLINGPYIHHMSEIYGDYTDVLEEFCKFIPELEFDPLED